MVKKSPGELPSERARRELKREVDAKWRLGVAGIVSRRAENDVMAPEPVDEVLAVEDIEVGVTSESAREFANTRRNMPEPPKGMWGAVRRWLGR